MAGLVFARMLTQHFERVTVIERDALPVPGTGRKGVPQGQHAHGLLASGFRVLEALFPGLSSELVALGAIEGDVGESGAWIVCGGQLARGATGLRSVLISRPLLEGQVRARLRELSQVTLLERCDVVGIHAPDPRRVSGVRITRRDAQTSEVLLADLVVDTTGRGSRAPAWLSELGFEAPLEERVKIDIEYTTVTYRREPHHLNGAHAAIVAAAPPNRRSGVAVAREGNCWTVTFAGSLGERIVQTHQGVVDFARGLPDPILYDLVSSAEPLSEPVAARFPHSQRRRYERLGRFPQGFLVAGDAMCSFNPIYGQGMSVAALEAMALDACLREGAHELAARFFRRAAHIVDAPWQVAVGNDLRFPEVQGTRPFGSGLVNAYLARLQRAAHRDRVTARAFLQVMQLTAPPASLFAPALLWKALVLGGESSKHVAHRRSVPLLSQPS